MSLSRRLSPITSRLAHTLAAKKTAKDLATRSEVIRAELGIYFAGPVGDIYQVTQWLSVFEQVNEEFPTVLLVKDAPAARALAAACSLPIRLVGSADGIEPLISAWGLRALFYVNNNLANFSPLRLTDLTHIHLSHGESEKASMTSNQLKAYDYCFIAGRASAQRILSALARFDPSHLKEIGRPQLDQLLTCEPLSAVAGRRSVLYAPTWEGDRAAMAYSSVALAGVRWVTEILQDSTLRLIYRPHPKTGTRSKATHAADLQIRKLIVNAQRENPGAQHLVDLQNDYHPALAGADLGIFDVSAMAMDFSVLARPYFVACPAHLESTLENNALWTVARKLASSGSAALLPDLKNAWEAGPLPHAEEFVQEHFGETAQGAAMGRFKTALATLLH